MNTRPSALVLLVAAILSGCAQLEAFFASAEIEVQAPSFIDQVKYRVTKDDQLLARGTAVTKDGVARFSARVEKNVTVTLEGQYRGFSYYRRQPAVEEKPLFPLIYDLKDEHRIKIDRTITLVGLPANHDGHHLLICAAQPVGAPHLEDDRCPENTVLLRVYPAAASLQVEALPYLPGYILVYQGESRLIKEVTGSAPAWSFNVGG